MSDGRGELRGVPYVLWEDEQAAEREIDRLTADIEDLERQITKSRDRREELRLRIVELRVSRNLLADAGIKVERIGSDVHVSVERVLASPNPPTIDTTRNSKTSDR